MNLKTHFIFFIVGLLTLSSSFSSCSSNQRSHYIITENKIKHFKNKYEYNEIAAERGKQVYEARCMRCHGPDARGSEIKIPGHTNSPMDLVKLVREVPSVHFLIKFSEWTNMPGWETPLSSEDSEDLIHYLKKISKPKS